MESRLKIAREGFRKGKLEHSKKAHEIKAIQTAKEEHKSGGEYLGDFVFGAIDGSITTFAVVSGVAGASLSSSIVLILGFANLLADGFSMAIGNYLSSKSDIEYVKREREREEWEVENFPEGEVEEIRQIFKRKGLKGKELDGVVQGIVSNKKVWVDTMMTEELGLINQPKNPLKSGLFTFIAFVIVGFIPLSSYVLSYFFEGLKDVVYPISIILTVITFFLIGSSKVHLTGKKWWVSGFETLLIGSAAAIIAYVIGYLLRSLA